MYLAVNQPLAIAGVDLRGRNSASKICRGIEHRVTHAERRENLLARKAVERSTGDSLQNFAKQDEIEVAVFRFCARFVNERLTQNAFDHFLFGFRCLEVLHMSGQAASVG